jgi:hypothetical protein
MKEARGGTRPPARPPVCSSRNCSPFWFSSGGHCWSPTLGVQRSMVDTGSRVSLRPRRPNPLLADFVSLLTAVQALTERVVATKTKWRATPGDVHVLQDVSSLCALPVLPGTTTRWPLALAFLLSARFLLDERVSALHAGTN